MTRRRTEGRHTGCNVPGNKRVEAAGEISDIRTGRTQEKGARFADKHFNQDKEPNGADETGLKGGGAETMVGIDSPDDAEMRETGVRVGTGVDVPAQTVRRRSNKK